jgi:SAM-dependent methyltransferase
MSRSSASRLAHAAAARSEPLTWIEELYSQAESDDTSSIPWADLRPNPNLVEWLDSDEIKGEGKQALSIGCGLGDDAEELARRGFAVVAFDISPSAIALAQRRFAGSAVVYQAIDLFRSPADRDNQFDFVQESYTLQVLPPTLRLAAIAKMTSFVAPAGDLLVIARARNEGDDKGQMPWPLTRREMDFFVDSGLEQLYFEDYLDSEQPPVRRFRATYGKPQ